MKKVLMMTLFVFIVGGIMLGLFKVVSPIINKIGYDIICQEAIEEIKADAEESGAEIISVTFDDDGIPYELYYREGEYIIHVRTDTNKIEYYKEGDDQMYVEKSTIY